MVRIASVSRVNGPACGHFTIVVEERDGTSGPADRSATISVPEAELLAGSSIDALGALIAELPGMSQARLKGAFLFSSALYEMKVNGRTLAQVTGVWVG